MKKLLIVLGVIAAFITATAFVTSQNNKTLPGPGDSCKLVGNCTVELRKQSEGRYYVYASNNNNYPVTVDWTATGYDSNGKMRRVGGGTLSLAPAGKDYSRANSSVFTTSTEDVSLGNVYVKRCE